MRFLSSLLKTLPQAVLILWILLQQPLSTSTLATGDAGDEGLLNQLLAPGPLMSGHIQLEQSKCLECHVLRQGISDAKCLACHDSIRKQVLKKTGYHGLTAKTCIQCHSDHKGRDYDSTQVDLKNFNHKTTGYLLEGKHQTIECVACHTQKRANPPRKGDPSFLGLQTSCVSCHKKDDVHFFNKEWSKKSCNSCHGMKSWKDEVRFDHVTVAHYPLHGKHAEISCAKCHVPKQGRPSIYKWDNFQEMQCLSCHQSPHRGSFSEKFNGGRACIKCHTEVTWKVGVFDHSLTGFKLVDKHAKLQCAQCHKGTSSQTPLKSVKFKGLVQQCASCHKKDDVHFFNKEWANKGCNSCHGVKGWREDVRFEHLSVAHYALKGKHAQISCAKCHVPKRGQPSIYKWNHFQQSQCLSCHQSPHLRSFSEKFSGGQACLKCHTEVTWKVPVFDHSMTGYPLRDKHANLQCAQCHKQVQPNLPLKSFKFSGLVQKCDSCHKDPHLFGNLQTEKLGNLSDCTRCHVESSWKDTPHFVHNTDTNFKIGGKHLGLACIKCHTLNPGVRNKERIYHWPSLEQKTCETCHASPHRDTFTPELLQKRCTECHTDQSWGILQGSMKKADFNHDQTRFKLTGNHRRLECSSCHSVNNKEVFKFPSFTKNFCVDCHRNEHLDQFHSKFSSQACSVCHSTNGFIRTLPFNHKSTAFEIKGKHIGLECVKCHTPTQSNFQVNLFHFKSKYIFPELEAKDCATCHQDPHLGNYGSACSQCHVEQGWKAGVAKFHASYTLTGAHFTLQCNQCHQEQRKLSGASQMCRTCHQKDDNHQGTLPDCGQCHSQQFWENPTFRHSLTQFPLTGTHRTLACSACHANNIYKGLNTTCVSCHINDALSFVGPPKHQPLLGRSCSDCHTTFSFGH